MEPRLTTAIRSLVELLTGKISRSEELTKIDDPQLFNKEVDQQKLELQVAYEQAKVAQEIAIAERIRNADEVVLEEYYEVAAKGQIGANTGDGNVSIGVSGEGRQVTKRIYRFIGGSNLQEIETADKDA